MHDPAHCPSKIHACRGWRGAIPPKDHCHHSRRRHPHPPRARAPCKCAQLLPHWHTHHPHARTGRHRHRPERCASPQVGVHIIRCHWHVRRPSHHASPQSSSQLLSFFAATWQHTPRDERA
eukprot:6219621-Prymnesium_polylepis.1